MFNIRRLRKLLLNCLSLSVFKLQLMFNKDGSARIIDSTLEIDSIDPPVMRPNRELDITIEIEEVSRGKPSVCDEEGW